MKCSIKPLLCSLAGLTAGPLLAGPAEQLQSPNWDVQLARQSAAVHASEAVLSDWFELARQGRTDELVTAFTHYTNNTAMPAPARDLLVYQLALGLSDFPVEQVSPALLSALQGYRVQTRVAHEEDASVGVPLFNVAAAVRGLQHAGERQRGQLHADTLRGAPPQKWLAAYIAASGPARLGMVDGLAELNHEELQSLLGAALRRLSSEPGLSEVAAAAALQLQDIAAVQQVMIQGSGPSLTSLLRAVDRQVQQPQRAALLMALIESGPAEAAALGIALLAPGLTERAEVTETLLSLLGDAHLGAAAALALARHPAAEVSTRLEHISSGSGAAAQHGRQALQIRNMAGLR